MASDETSESKPKRAPRKRAVKKRTSTTTSRTTRRAPRKTAAKKAAPARAASTTRKAPTPIAATRAASKAKRNQMVVVAVVLLLGVGASAAIGFTDEGRIDVNGTIEARNARIQAGQGDPNEGAAQNVVVPVQDTTRQADGGLRGLGVGSANRQPKPEPEPTATSTASSTATSTDATATSTAETTIATDSTAEETTTEEETDTSEPIPVPTAPFEDPPPAEPAVEGASTTYSGSGR